MKSNISSTVNCLTVDTDDLVQYKLEKEKEGA